MPDELPVSGRRGNSISGEELLRKLTGMAADVVRECSVELALGWLWCDKTREPLPRVPPDLVDVRPGSWLAGSGRVLQGPGLFRGLPAPGFAQIAGRRTAQDTVTQPCGSRGSGTPGPHCRAWDLRAGRAARSVTRSVSALLKSMFHQNFTFMHIAYA
jgi:hypothetical protein